MRVGPAVLAGLLVSTMALDAVAHDSRVSVRVDGDACPAHDELRREAESRGARIDEDAPVRLRVRMSRASERNVAVDVSGEGPRGAIASRSFVAASCAEAIDAAALLVALSGSDAAEPEPDPQPEPTPAPAPIVVAQPPIAEQPSPPPRRREATTALYASGGAFGTSLGEGQVGGRLALGFEAKRTWLPWIEASAAVNAPRAIAGGGGEATLVWITGRAAVAPIGVTLSPQIVASPWVGAEAGALAGSGDGTARVESRTRPWLAAVAGARVRWDVGRRLFAGIDAAAVAPLLRDSFVFVNGGTAYRTPPVAFETALSLGARLP